MNNYPQSNGYQGFSSGSGVDAVASQAIKRVYVKMFLGLLVTAFVALWGASSVSFLNFFVTNRWFMWLLFGAELLIVFSVSGSMTRMKSSTASMLFYLFALINGLALCPIFILYTGTSIAKTFFITAGTFGAMSVYGYFTTNDLTRWGSVLIMALFGLIIVSVVNIFLKSDSLSWIISGAGVLIFVGLTAWDTQKIKQWCQVASPEQIGHIATIGALSLYLDFINLFLYLLRFFGSSRD